MKRTLIVLAVLICVVVGSGCNSTFWAGVRNYDALTSSIVNTSLIGGVGLALTAVPDLVSLTCELAPDLPFCSS